MENETNSNAAVRGKTLRALTVILAALVIAVASFFAGFFIKGCSQDAQIRSMQWMLDTIEDNYFFYDDFDADAAKNLSLYAIASKLDRYSEYYTKEQYQAQLRDNSGEKSGVGVSYSFVGGKGVLLNTVVGNSPADKAGLRAGDYLVGGEKNGQRVTFI